jgi:hypothetical protein
MKVLENAMPASFQSRFPTRRVDQDLPHRFTCRSKEVGPPGILVVSSARRV